MSAMSEGAVNDALSQVAMAITEAARAPHRTAAELKLLAEAAAQLKYGPVGADYRYRSLISQDYHSTTHEPEGRQERPAGFS